MEKIYNEKGFLIAGDSYESVPERAEWIIKKLTTGANPDNITEIRPEQVYENIMAVSARMNEIAHIFCKEESNKDSALILTKAQRLYANNIMFHLARHEYGQAIKEFVAFFGEDANRRLDYNEAILVTILADAFEDTMTYRKHRPVNMFDTAVKDLTTLRGETEEKTEKNLDAFVREFDARTEALETADAAYTAGRKALFKAFIYTLLENQLLPKSSKGLSDVESLMMQMYNTTDVPVITEYIEAVHTSGSLSDKANDQYRIVQDLSVRTLNMVWARLLCDIRAVLTV